MVYTHIHGNRRLHNDQHLSLNPLLPFLLGECMGCALFMVHIFLFSALNDLVNAG